MYTELIRIIEAGLAGDPARVGRYARRLASNLEQEGDATSSRRIRRAIEKGPGGHATLDRLATAPVDQDTRMAIADLHITTAEDVAGVVLPEGILTRLNDFANRIEGRAALDRAGVPSRSSLLLHGLPGTGKTTLASWLAYTVELPLVVGRLDAMVSSMLGGTSRNIRRLFDFAAQQPCVLFLDELDAVAKTRADPHEMGELKRGVNSLLQNADSFLEAGGVLVAATNHPELLDRAVWRRFAQVVEVAYPNAEGVRLLLARHLPPDAKISAPALDRLVAAFEGMSPADILTVLNNARARSVLDSERVLTFEDILADLYRHRWPEKHDPAEAIAFLLGHGASRRGTTLALSVSGRQVRAKQSRLRESDVLE